jgi:hypothetical protein
MLHYDDFEVVNTPPPLLRHIISAHKQEVKVSCELHTVGYYTYFV